MKKAIIAGITISPVTVEALEESGITKPALVNHLSSIGITVPKGPISKTDLIDIVVDHYEFSQDSTNVASTDLIQAEPDVELQPTQDELDAIANAKSQGSINTVFIPLPSNAPQGMVYCKYCSSHVPKSGTIPTSELNVYVCLKDCRKGKGIAQAAKAANQAAKATTTQTKAASAPKTPRTGKYAPSSIITQIGPRNVKPGSYSFVTYNLLKEGMTVQDFYTQVAEAGKAGLCGTINGPSDLDFHVTKGIVKIVSAEEYNTTK